jgi:protein TonB
MFEHYLHHQQIDPRRRARIAVAANLAGVATASLMAFVWVGGKLQIAKVDAPTSEYALFQMSALERTPLPPPPPPPLGDAREDTTTIADEPVEDELVPVEDITQPEDAPAPAKLTLKKRGSPLGAINGVPLGTGTSPISALLIGNRIPLVRDTIHTPTRPSKRVVPEPIAAMRACCVYCPDPDGERLAATKAGMFDRRSGTNRTSFCVDPGGRTSKIRTVTRFPGDPGVDAICRATVKRWRLKPLQIGGRAVSSCSTVTFEMKFNK